MEAEYMTRSHGAIEAILLRLVLEDIGLVQLEATPTKCDNQGCLALAKNPKHHSKTKHFDIQHYFIREKIKIRMIDIKYCATKYILVDLLINVLVKDMHHMLTKVLGLKAFDNY